MRRQSNRTRLQLERLESRDMPSAALTSFQWGIGRGISEGSSAMELTSSQWGVGSGTPGASPAHSQVVEDVRLRRVVMDAAAAPTGGTNLAARPTETITFNFETITLN
jgi:hypothetical protein